MAKTKKDGSQKENGLTLEVKARTVFGKQLKKIRADGVVPANIFGPDFKTTAISATFRDFIQTYKRAKETGVVHLHLDSQKIPVLIKHVQKHPISDAILHVDFRKIDLKQKITTAVPVKVTGQSEAVSQKGGVLLTMSETLLVEALPTEIPAQIEIDIASLKEIGQEIKVADLKKVEAYLIKEDLNKVVIAVVAHKEESITPETAPATTPEVLTEAKPEEGAEAEVSETPKTGAPVKETAAKPEASVTKEKK